ncbi:hypothetical protein ABIF52_007644 [Bradyrhizobium japonicum]
MLSLLVCESCESVPVTPAALFVVMTAVKPALTLPPLIPI